jgi:hypothetical protein
MIQRLGLEPLSPTLDGRTAAKRWSRFRAAGGQLSCAFSVCTAARSRCKEEINFSVAMWCQREHQNSAPKCMLKDHIPVPLLRACGAEFA